MTSKTVPEHSEKEKMAKRLIQIMQKKDRPNDVYELVENLVDIRDEVCRCMFPSKITCRNTCPSPNQFGVCEPHMKTSIGINLAMEWNTLLDEAGIEESENGNETSAESEKTDASDESGSDQSDSDESGSDEVVAQPTTRVAPKDLPTARPTTRPVLKDDRPKDAPKTPPTRPAPKEAAKNTETEIVMTGARKQEAPAKKLPAQAAEPVAEPSPERVVKPKRSRKPKADPVPVPADDESAVDSSHAAYVPPTEEDDEQSPEAPSLVFRQSQFGNFKNEETGFVIRAKDRVILGTENKKGGITKLTKEQIEMCKKRGYLYLE